MHCKLQYIAFLCLINKLVNYYKIEFHIFTLKKSKNKFKNKYFVCNLIPLIKCINRKMSNHHFRNKNLIEKY